jgi:hypothetical protein
VALRPQSWRQKIRLNLLGGVPSARTQQPICRSAHLSIIDIAVITVKRRFDFNFKNLFLRSIRRAFEGTGDSVNASFFRLEIDQGSVKGPKRRRYAAFSF